MHISSPPPDLCLCRRRCCLLLLLLLAAVEAVAPVAAEARLLDRASLPAAAATDVGLHRGDLLAAAPPVLLPARLLTRGRGGRGRRKGRLSGHAAENEKAESVVLTVNGCDQLLLLLYEGPQHS
jgi:hypothetical protein